jgi:hypothetical protein
MYEEQLIRKITACTGAIRRGDKAPSQTDAGKMLNSLKAINLPMYEDLLEKYKEAVESYETKKAK